MGLGYGSEFQLMRFLGHHRNLLNKHIRNAVGAEEDASVEWLDYPFNSDNKSSGDGEWKKIECFRDREDYEKIETEWKKYWPQSGNAMNWDGIFRIGDTWYFVEAKASKKEAHQSCNAKADSPNRSIIKKAFTETISWLKSDESKEWINSDCYQLANRFAFIQFCEEVGIDAKLLYISFCNDEKRKDNDYVSSKIEWEEIWKEEYEMLGIDEDLLKGKLYHIYLDCLNGQ